MYKYPSCSFHSSFSAINTSQLESKQKSILHQYQKLRQNQQTPQYSIQVLPYLQLPKYFDKDIKQRYKQCILLDRFTFFQMFTMMIVQYLFKSPSADKLHKINNLKALIYSQQFLQGNTYTKGLLIKGIKQLQQYTSLKQYSQPLGQCLLNCDSICAFTQCWKQLIAKLCKQNNIPIISQHQIDSSIFQLFASYFHINFEVYWKERGIKFWKQYFTFDQANPSTDILTVVVNPQYQISISQRSIKITQSRSSGKSINVSGLSSSKNNNSSNSWNYILLTNPPPPVSVPVPVQRQYIHDQHVQRYQFQDNHRVHGHGHGHGVHTYHSHNTNTNTNTNINNSNRRQKKYSGHMDNEKIIKNSRNSQNNKNQISNNGPNVQQISHISQIDYSCGETQEIKILLDDKVQEHTTTAKKLGNFKKQINYYNHNHNHYNHNHTYQSLSNIMNSMGRANYLIEEMKRYTEYLEKLQMPKFDQLQLRY